MGQSPVIHSNYTARPGCLYKAQFLTTISACLINPEQYVISEPHQNKYYPTKLSNTLQCPDAETLSECRIVFSALDKCALIWTRLRTLKISSQLGYFGSGCSKLIGCFDQLSTKLTDLFLQLISSLGAAAQCNPLEFGIDNLHASLEHLNTPTGYMDANIYDFNPAPYHGVSLIVFTSPPFPTRSILPLSIRHVSVIRKRPHTRHPSSLRFPCKLEPAFVELRVI